MSWILNLSNSPSLIALSSAPVKSWKSLTERSGEERVCALMAAEQRLEECRDMLQGASQAQQAESEGHATSEYWEVSCIAQPVLCLQIDQFAGIPRRHCV